MPVDVDDWVMLLQRPGVHDVLDGERVREGAVFAGSLRQMSPQVVLLSVVILTEEGRDRTLQ